MLETVLMLVVGLVIGAGATMVLMRRAEQNRADAAQQAHLAALASAEAAAYERGKEWGKSELRPQAAALEERVAAREAALADLQQRLHALEAEAAQLRQRAETMNAQLESERAAATEKLAAAEKISQDMVTRFQALSSEALQKNNQSFLDLAKQTLATYQEGAKGDLDKRQQAIGELIAPMKASLEKFEQQVQGVEKQRVEAYATLTEQVKALTESQTGLRTETANLVKALRAPQTRGRWGEVQLKRVVEMAGMVDRCDFKEQENTDTDEGRLRPDMVVNLPGGKTVVVDAKAPLMAYLEALETQDPDQAKLHMKTHARQVKDHLTMLGRKAYWEQFQPSPEFVVLFLPGEAFYSAALEADPALIEYGVEQKVILATPTTLIAVLKAVAYGWKQEALAENAHRISALGKELFERLCVVADAWGDVGRHIENSVKAYNKSVSSLESRLFVTARKFKELGVGSEDKELKELNPIESLPRETKPLEAKVISIKD